MDCSSACQDAMHEFRVLPDFIFSAREHSDQDAVVGLDAAEGGAECLLYAPVIDSAGSENLERKAGLPRLPHHVVHPGRIALHIDFVRHLGDLTVQYLLPFILRAGAVVDTTGIEVHVPALFFDLADDFGFMGAHSDNNADIAYDLAPLPNRVHLALLERLIDNFALPEHG